MEKDEKTVEIIKALGDRTRFKILKALSSSGNNLCVTAISDMLHISQPVVSQHLKVLKNAGIVKADRRGYHIHYSIDAGIISDVSDYIRSLTDIVHENCIKNGCKKKRT